MRIFVYILVLCLVVNLVSYFYPCASVILTVLIVILLITLPKTYHFNSVVNRRKAIRTKGIRVELSSKDYSYKRNILNLNMSHQEVSSSPLGSGLLTNYESRLARSRPGLRTNSPLIEKYSVRSPNRTSAKVNSVQSDENYVSKDFSVDGGLPSPIRSGYSPFRSTPLSSSKRFNVNPHLSQENRKDSLNHSRGMSSAWDSTSSPAKSTNISNSPSVRRSLNIEEFGRKTVILWLGPVMGASFALKALSRSLPVMFALRLVQGACMGAAYAACPIYIAEVAEPRLRGSASSHFQTLWYLGISFAYCVGPYVDYQTYAWICIAMPLLFTVTFCMMPESPYYLLMKGKKDEARRALVWLRAKEDVDDEFRSIQSTIEKEAQHEKGSWKELFLTKKDRKAFFIVQVCCFTKYMNGMSAFVTYISQTFGESGHNLLGHNELTILIGFLLTAITFLSSFLSDNIGRRPMLIYSSIGCSCFLIVIGLYYFFEFETTVNVGPYIWLLYVSLIGYMFMANIGLGPLMQTIQAEFFSSKTRGVGGGLTLIVASVSAFWCMKQYQLVQDLTGVYLNYWIYAAVCLNGAVWLHYYMPETAGRSLGQIQTDLENKDL